MRVKARYFSCCELTADSLYLKDKPLHESTLLLAGCFPGSNSMPDDTGK
jgi:hypothetical protein